jgi:hypothetical protein
MSPGYGPTATAAVSLNFTEVHTQDEFERT